MHDPLIADLAALPDGGEDLHIDLDAVITGVRTGRRRRRRTVATVLLATAAVTAGLITVTTQFNSKPPTGQLVGPGTPWTVIAPLKNPRLDVVAVAAVSPTEAWTFGFDITTQSGGVADRWDGTRWRRYPLPDKYVPIDAVALAPDNVWVVGRIQFPEPGVAARPIALRWDGTAWRDIPIPPIGTQDDLGSVTAVSADDIWVAGSAGLRHWDGHNWTAVASAPIPGAGNWGFQTIAARAANDVWAVGMSDAPPGERPFTMHWDGHRWSLVPFPEVRGVHTLNDVLPLAPNDVWAVGGQRVFHWDGAQWRDVTVAAAAFVSYQVVSDGAGGVVIAGREAPCLPPPCQGPPPGIRVARWNGTEWRPIQAPARGNGNIGGLSTPPGGGTVWVVGGTVPRDSRDFRDSTYFLASISLRR